MDKELYEKLRKSDGIPVNTRATNAYVIVSDCAGGTQTLCFDLDSDESEDQIDFYSDARAASSMLCVTRYNIPPGDIYGDTRLGFYEVECWDKEILGHIERFANERELQDWLRSFFYRHEAFIVSRYGHEDA